VTLGTAPTPDLSAQVIWFKPAGVRTTYYTNGFLIYTNALGSRYVAPGRGTSVLNLTNGITVISGGDLAQTVTNLCGFGRNNTMTNAGSAKPILTFTPSTGLFKAGTALTNAPKAMGVVLQNQNQGRGYFLGTNQSGQVLIEQENQ
jgi:hypothetical protein